MKTYARHLPDRIKDSVKRSKKNRIDEGRTLFDLFLSGSQFLTQMERISKHVYNSVVIWLGLHIMCWMICFDIHIQICDDYHLFLQMQVT